MRDHPSFGAWLKRRRKALDLTQADLARLVGCAVVSIRKIEADAQRPSRQTAARLAQQLQLAADEQATFVQFARLGPDDVPPALTIPAAAPLPAHRRTNAISSPLIPPPTGPRRGPAGRSPSCSPISRAAPPCGNTHPKRCAPLWRVHLR